MRLGRVLALLGLAVAAGSYVAAIVATVLAVVTLSGLKPLERWLSRAAKRNERSSENEP